MVWSEQCALCAISHLDSVEVEFRTVVTAPHGRRGSATETDAVRRPPNLHDEVPDLAILLVQMRVVDLPKPSGKHHGLEPLAAGAVREAAAVGAAEPRDDRLPKLVAVRRGAVRGVHQNLSGQGLRV